jgi:hypothetical protein
MSDNNLKLWSCYPNDLNETQENFLNIENFEEGDEVYQDGDATMDGMAMMNNMDASLEGAVFQDDMCGQNNEYCNYEEEMIENFEEENYDEENVEGGGEPVDGQDVDYEDEANEGFEDVLENEEEMNENEEVYEDEEVNEGFENDKNLELWTCYPSNNVENFQSVGESLTNLKSSIYGTSANADLYMYITIALIIVLLIYFFYRN